MLIFLLLSLGLKTQLKRLPLFLWFCKPNSETPTRLTAWTVAHLLVPRDVSLSLRVEFLLKTESGYLRDAEVT